MITSASSRGTPPPQVPCCRPCSTAPFHESSGSPARRRRGISIVFSTSGTFDNPAHRAQRIAITREQRVGGDQRNPAEATLPLQYASSATSTGNNSQVVIGEQLDRLPGPGIHSNHHHLKALRAVLLLHAVHGQDYAQALHAPGGGEVDQHHLAVELLRSTASTPTAGGCGPAAACAVPILVHGLTVAASAQQQQHQAATARAQRLCLPQPLAVPLHSPVSSILWLVTLKPCLHHRVLHRLDARVLGLHDRSTAGTIR